MSESRKVAHHASSLTPSTLHFFKASLLCVSLISAFYLHPSISLPLISTLAVSVSFVFANITSICRKMEPRTKDNQDELLTHEIPRNEESNIGEKESHGLISCAGYATPELGSSSSSYDDKMVLGDMEEDYVIEITLPEQPRKRQKLAEPVLLQQGLEDFLSDVNGGDGLIEIDISMGSIKH